ncbi:hypothetical protein OURE66S_01088 [Oligella ureolytica]
MSRKKHSSEFKCLVVQYFLEMHRGYTLTARHFSLERSVVRSWVRRYRTHGVITMTLSQLICGVNIGME